MKQVCDVLAARIEKGHYNSMLNEIPRAWKGLKEWPKEKNACKDEVFDITKDKEETLPKRLDFNTILKHYQEFGRSKTYWSQPTNQILATGERAQWVYVMPKYKLGRVTEDIFDMQCMMRLAHATTRKDVHDACANAKTGTYDVQRHMELRNKYVILYVTDTNIIRDTHRHYIQGGGFSEHSLFIERLWTKIFRLLD